MILEIENGRRQLQHQHSLKKGDELEFLWYNRIVDTKTKQLLKVYDTYLQRKPKRVIGYFVPIVDSRVEQKGTKGTKL